MNHDLTIDYKYQREKVNELVKERVVCQNAYDGLETERIKQVQLIVQPPFEAAQFVKFLRLTRESLNSRTAQIAGSSEVGCSITIYLENPISVAVLLAKLDEICKVEALSFESHVKEQCPEIVKEMPTIQELENDQNRAIFVNLNKN
jgi:hypothetical protein